MRLRVGKPLWLRGMPNHRRFRPLTEGIHADVVIVGGGITGAALAWTLVRAGVDAVVLEAKRIGRGSTAASSALLMHELDRDLSELTRWYGAADATRIWRLARASATSLTRALRQCRIDCDLVESDAVYFTSNADKVPHLREEIRRRRAAGFDERWMDRAALKEKTGIDAPGAIRSSGNARLDPYRACVGLVGDAAARGVRIFEDSPVRAIETSRSGVTVRTPRGSVSAPQVIIATGYATPEFRPLGRRFTMVHTYVLVTEPLGALARAALGLRDVMLWDTERPYHYARWTPDHRLLLGGGDRPIVPPARRRRAFAESTAQLRLQFERLWPSLRSVRTEYAWEGVFANTPDGLPYIGPHRRYPRHLFALGYGGNGMMFSFLAAGLLRDRLVDKHSADLELFGFARGS